MPLRCYRPPIHRVQQEYCAEVARRLRRQKRGPRPAGPKTPDNSEPWIADPKTLSDLWAIAQHAAAREVGDTDKVDLILTKEAIGGEQDAWDVFFRERKVRCELGARLEEATPEEAEAIFARYFDHAVCERALDNPHTAVRERAKALLAELAESGDRFARDVLARLAGGA